MTESKTRGTSSAEVALVTGASSGIGHATALHLARNGFRVLATVRKETDLAVLRALGVPGLVPVRLDLNNLEDLPQLVKTADSECERAGQPGLAAIVNNAGGSVVAPIELMDMRRFSAEVDARLVGAVALVQAFLPSIRRAKGRVIWIATPATIPTPYVTAIHACDFAVNCIARTLWLELKRWGTPVILIKCGGIRTRAGLSTLTELDATLAACDAEQRMLYETQLRRWGASMAEFDKKRTQPERVAETVERALRARRPSLRYRVGYLSGAAALFEAMPQRLIDRILAARI